MELKQNQTYIKDDTKDRYTVMSRNYKIMK